MEKINLSSPIGRDTTSISFSYYEVFAGFLTAILNNTITLPDVDKNPKIKKAMITAIIYADAYQGKTYEENKEFYKELEKKDYYEVLFVMFKKMKEIGLVHTYKSYGESYFKRVVSKLAEKYDELTKEEIKQIME